MVLDAWDIVVYAGRLIPCYALDIYSGGQLIRDCRAVVCDCYGIPQWGLLNHPNAAGETTVSPVHIVLSKSAAIAHGLTLPEFARGVELCHVEKFAPGFPAVRPASVPCKPTA